MPPLTMQDKGLTRGMFCPPTALGQVPLKALPQVLGKAVSRPPGPGVPGGSVSPHVSMGRATCPLLWAAAPGTAQPCGVSLTTRGIAPARLRYDRLTLVGPRCMAGNPLLDCVPACLSPVASMAPGDVCHGLRCSLARVGPVALRYGPCHWPDGLAASPQCVRPMGCWLFPVPRPPYVCSCVRCPQPLGSCSPRCPLGVLCCVCGGLGHVPPAHRCARSMRCFVCAVFWGTWLCFTGAPARCVGLLVSRSRPLGSVHCSARVLFLCCVCGVLGHLAPVHGCYRSVRCFALPVSWATWLLFTRVPARCAVLRVRCPGPLGSCSPLCPLGVLCCVCGVLGHLAPVHGCARLVCCVVLLVRCPGRLGSCSPVCLLRPLLCLCGVPGHLAPVHQCVRSVCCVACAVS